MVLVQVGAGPAAQDAPGAQGEAKSERRMKDDDISHGSRTSSRSGMNTLLLL